jgi:hypothetical protein
MHGLCISVEPLMSAWVIIVIKEAGHKEVDHYYVDAADIYSTHAQAEASMFFI